MRWLSKDDVRLSRLINECVVPFHHDTIERILTNCVTVWFGSCTNNNQETIQCKVNAA